MYSFFQSSSAEISPVKRRRAEQGGRLAEDLVAGWWRACGFTILAQRMKTPAGEIDLIAADRDHLVFIEVKARPSFADAAYAVSARQQARLLEAASVVLAEHPEWHRDIIRFDAALVCGSRVECIEDAIRYN